MGKALVSGAGGHRQRPKLADVAQAAGVSLKTASRALNGEPYVAAETSQRVLKAAKELQFHFNAAASRLKRGSSGALVGLIVGDLLNPFSMAVAKGAELELRGRGESLLIVSSDEDPETEKHLVEDLIRQRVEGVLLVSTRDTHTDLGELIDRGARFVFLDRAPVGVHAPAVVLDNFGGTFRAVQSLIERGHHRIAFIGDHARLAPQVQRRAGYVSALEQADIVVDERLIVAGAHDVAAASAALRALLTLDEPPTAFFTANNRVTVGALAALRSSGSAAALIGFDDFELADAMGVSTVSSDLIELGREGVRLLRRGPAEEKRIMQLPAELVQRGSGERTHVL